MEQNVLAPTDVFKRHFDIPSLPSNLVFDFESDDDDNRDITPESILLNSVLLVGVRESQGASALSAHGMGGVGKATALKRICSTGSVQGLLVDGVCFMEFGQDATLQKVREEMVQEMRKASCLSDVVTKAAEWLEDRAVLLVCDNLWATDENELGYALLLKKMLRDALKSGFLISTRDRTIPHAVSVSPVSSDCVEPEGPRARKILGKAAFGDNYEEIISNWDAEPEYVEILKICAGLPLAFGIAGSGVKFDWEDSKDASFSVKTYCSGLMSGALNQLQGANAEHRVDGLKYVVEASLKLCEKWGISGGRTIDIRHLYRSLSVLEKQKLIPESTLEQYWDLDKRQMGGIVRKFRNLILIKRDLLKESTSNDGEVSEFHVHIQDLVLELCHGMVVDEKEKWHLRLINAYRLRLLPYRIKFDVGSIIYCRCPSFSIPIKHFSRVMHDCF